LFGFDLVICLVKIEVNS